MTPTRKLPPLPHPHFWPKSTNILYGRPHLAWNFQIPSPPAIWTSFMFAPFLEYFSSMPSFSSTLLCRQNSFLHFRTVRKQPRVFGCFHTVRKCLEIFRTVWYAVSSNRIVHINKCLVVAMTCPAFVFYDRLFIKDAFFPWGRIGVGTNLLRDNKSNKSNLKL